MTEVAVPILDLNAFKGEGGAHWSGDLRRMVDRRQRSFGAGSVLFFREPLMVDHASGQYVFGADGRRYLDLYNNVPSVGHGNPRVAEAVYRQMLQVNAHSRYLYDIVETYAERLLATYPVALSNVVFTCTGSEANDLALRLARLKTGKTGIIVTRAAYHGNTTAVTEISPSSFKSGQPPAHVAIVDAPDPAVYGTDLGAGFAAAIKAAIDRLEADGFGFAAFIADSIFSSDGVFADPPGFLAAAIDVVKAAGGLYIADEVQPGFCRTGDSFWGFERHGVEPDIVTMGKPMGNGFPVAGLVTRPELLSLLASRFGYFNTFGGTPAAAAAGLAVLDALTDDGLRDNARVVGAYMRERLRSLAKAGNFINAVRGAGLYVGVEIGDGSAEMRMLGGEIVNGLREEGILIGLAGANADVLKVRPPLCLSTEDVDTFADALGRVLGRL